MWFGRGSCTIKPDTVVSLLSDVICCNRVSCVTEESKWSNLKHIPTVVLTTSNNNEDITECYRIGIAGYMLKPLKYADYEKKISVILEYWSLNQFKFV